MTYMAENELINENVLVAFVDTSALDPMFNDYSHMEHQLVALKKHIDSKKLILLTHEIAIREMENHIREEVSKQLEKLSGVQSSKELVLLKSIKKYAPLLGAVDKETIIADLIPFFAIPLNSIPRKIISSRKPTRNILKTERTAVKTSVSKEKPNQRFIEEIRTRGT